MVPFTTWSYPQEGLFTGLPAHGSLCHPTHLGLLHPAWPASGLTRQHSASRTTPRPRVVRNLPWSAPELLPLWSNPELGARRLLRGLPKANCEIAFALVWADAFGWRQGGWHPWVKYRVLRGISMLGSTLELNWSKSQRSTAVGLLHKIQKQWKATLGVTVKITILWREEGRASVKVQGLLSWWSCFLGSVGQAYGHTCLVGVCKADCLFLLLLYFRF